MFKSAGDKNNKPLPYGVDVNYTDNYEQVIELINVVLVQEY